MSIQAIQGYSLMSHKQQNNNCLGFSKTNLLDTNHSKSPSFGIGPGTIHFITKDKDVHSGCLIALITLPWNLLIRMGSNIASKLFM